MAHFAKIDKDNIVKAVHVVSNDIATSEQAGIDFLNSLYPNNKLRWVQTSYNGNFRKHFAGIGSTYDADKDAFIHKKPYPSWVLNETTCIWEAPIDYPTDGNSYDWNETNQTWDLIEE
tara:strand:+ start:1896 stop:2249 length:354 start_codon:yes stop_codon:yes gene_type:complete